MHRGTVGTFDDALPPTRSPLLKPAAIGDLLRNRRTEDRVHRIADGP
ncbi:MAG: hypothetical protein ACYS15_01295 [Planctomycetota bacterium]|jgi:hypothetical protein